MFLALTKSGGGGGSGSKEGSIVKKEKKKAEKTEKKKEEKPAEPLVEELDETELALAAEPKSKDPFDALPKG
jgi:elongation factor 1-gamma